MVFLCVVGYNKIQKLICTLLHVYIWFNVLEEQNDFVLIHSFILFESLQSYVTHSIQVEGLRQIITVPAKLESTSLVFAYGVDLFFTRIAPSRTYDSLTEDFSYALLLLTIVVLITAIFVTWVLSEKKELQEKWR